MPKENQPHAFVRSQGNTPTDAQRVNPTRGGRLYREYAGNLSLLFPLNETQGITSPAALPVALGPNLGAQTIPAGRTLLEIDGDSITPLFNNANVLGRVPFIRFYKGTVPCSDYLPMAQLTQGNQLVINPVSPNGAVNAQVAAANGNISVSPPPAKWPTYIISFDRIEIVCDLAFQFQAIIAKGNAAYVA